ncbi:MAG: ParB/RepB/Spo0J family partition protein [Clostridiales bacterium]|jgi:ParB family chromosome partitioning protein|nr:ParB/RepB/Spo0J family partition protein [Clostridiales bacterium]
MAAKKRGGLGKGYDSIFLDNAVEQLTGGAGAVNIGINEIEPNRAQPRKSFDDNALFELSESIKQHGIIQPLLVRPIPNGGYQIVAGERRWRAARLAKLSEVPVIIRELDDEKSAQYALVENLQREDLNPVEEARGYKSLTEEYSYTQEEAAKLIGKSRSAVANSMRLLSLPDEALGMLESGKLTTGHAKALLSITDEKRLIETARFIIANSVSVRETERLVRDIEKSPAAIRARKRNPYYDEVELALSETLGRSVKLTKSAKKGTLQIEFFDDDDLNRLIKIFENDNN